MQIGASRNTSARAISQVARLAVGVFFVTLFLAIAHPALAGCPPDERPCGGTTTTAPSAPTAVPQPEPTPDNVMINVPAPTSPPSTQPSSCYDFPAPSFSLPHDGAGRLITQGMLWETVRDTLPGQSEWVEYHTDWPNFGDPCSTLYGKGVQDKTDLESFLAYLNSLAAQSNQSNNQEEPAAAPTSAPRNDQDENAPKTAQEGQTSDCSAEQQAFDEARAAKEAAQKEVKAAEANYQKVHDQALVVIAERLELERQKQILVQRRKTVDRGEWDSIDQEIADLQAQIEEYYSTKQPNAQAAVHAAEAQIEAAQAAANAASDKEDDAAEALENCQESLASAA